MDKMDKIPDVTITIDSNEYLGLARITASFVMLDRASTKSYHRVEQLVPAEKIKEAVASMIETADLMMDAIVARNIDVPVIAKVESAPDLGKELFKLGADLMDAQAGKNEWGKDCLH